MANQTLQPREVIVVDDATGGDSPDMICATARIENIKLIKLPRNAGPGAARNAGMAESTEAFLAFLDADDEWHSEKLRYQMDLMLGPNAPALSSHRKSFNGAAWPRLDARPQATSITRLTILISNVAPISTVVVRRDALRHEFALTYACEDYWFVAANVLSGLQAVRMNHTLARADKPAFGGEGLSGRLHAMQLGEMQAHFALWRSGLIGAWEYVPLVIWTLLKYLRRIAVVRLRAATRLTSNANESPGSDSLFDRTPGHSSCGHCHHVDHREDGRGKLGTHDN